MKLINFKNGDIAINDTTISFSDNSNNGMLPSQQVMERKLIGGINYEKYTFLRRTPMGYACISFVLSGISFIISILLGMNGFNLYYFFWITFIVTMIFSFTIFVGILSSILFDTLWERSLCEYLFGTKVYHVIIQNKSGGKHIEFYISMDELELAKELIDYKLEEIHRVEIESYHSDLNNLDINQKLIELSELLDKGILSSDEFQKLKKNLIKRL